MDPNIPDGGSKQDAPVRVQRTPEDLFGLLGHEVRIAIVCTLFEAERSDEPSVLSFGDLQDRVAVADSGRFTYHLKEIIGPFVREREQGYKLTDTGRAVCRTLVPGLYGSGDRPRPDVTDCPSCEGGERALGRRSG